MAELVLPDLDTILRGVGSVLGPVGAILGAFAFFRHRTAKKMRYLNEAVFRPWSAIRVKHVYGGSEGRPSEELHFVIPAKAVEHIEPTVTDDGLDIVSLNGFDDGKSFLGKPDLVPFSRARHKIRSRCRDAWREWNAVVELQQKYESVRERRRRALGRLITEDMKIAFPKLQIVHFPNPIIPNTFDFERLLAVTELNSNYTTRPDWQGPYLNAGQYPRDGTKYLQVSFDIWGVFLEMESDMTPDEGRNRFRKLMASWITPESVKEAARTMADYEARLNQATIKFGEAMRRLTFSLDLEFRPAE